MKCSECDLYRQAIVGLECPFREHVSLDDDACESGLKRKEAADNRAAAGAIGKRRAADFESQTPHGSMN